MKKPYLSELLKRYLHNDCTEGEAWTVEQWYEARDVPRPAALTPAETAATKAKMWRQVQAQMQPQPALWHSPVLRWAAAAILVLGVGLSMLVALQRPAVGTKAALGRAAVVRFNAANGWITCTNPTTKATTVALADGSTVALQPNSRLRYPKRFDGPERCVTLSGEAFFEVAHDPRHPFRVLTDKLETTVLGTSFTVRAFPGQADAAVMVRTGRVRVAPSPTPLADAQRATPPAIVLLPNQQVVYSAVAPELRRELVAQPAQLAPQLLTFDERPVAEVLASLQAAYGVPILYDGAALANCTVSLAFGQESLFDKLDLLCKTLGASYEREDEKIVFRSRGCHSE
ncbi:FecR family protein [Hymenobacter sp. B1770]|uniref:FecR family protein n=1 Tax=Hymenobacter sp. B1770 TaxID=1718788 RepID=UPI003CECEE66